MNLVLQVEIPRVDDSVSITTETLDMSAETISELSFQQSVVEDGDEIEVPQTTYVWLLSSATAQPIGTRGIWVDTDTWSDTNILYT